MRDYGKVSPKFWIGQTGKALRKHGMETQLVALYLLTNPHANMLGLYYVPTAFVAHETGLGYEGATKGLQGCIEAGFCQYDDDSEMVWVMEMARFQIADQLKDKDLRIKGVQNEYDALPGNPYLASFFAMYSEAFCMTSCRGRDSPSQAPCKPLASQEQEQEQEQEKPKPTSSAGADGDGAGEPKPEKVKPFDEFWEAYPWNAGKQDAQKAWIKVEKNWAKLNKHAPEAPMLETLLVAVAAQKEGADWKRDNGQYIPRAATWLNGGRWKDEVRPYVAPPLKLPFGWADSPEGMKAAGAMLTPPLTPRDGEGQKAFAMRIRIALGQADAPIISSAQTAPPAVLAAVPYIPPAVKDGEQLTDDERQARREEMRESLAKMKQKGGLALAGVAASNDKQAA